MSVFAAVRRHSLAGIGTCFLLGASLLTACDKDDETPGDAGSRAAAVAQYANVAHATYLDARDAAVTMRAALQTLVSTPTAANLTAARNAYIAARTPYEQTEAFRFYGGPIDGSVNGVEGPEGLMNGWPLDENYIDYTAGLPGAGIVNDAAAHPTISKATLAGLNGGGSETNISTGYHALEFLLWGQDLSITGPGARPYTDYVTGAGGTGGNAARRGQYLLAAADLLLDNLNTVLAQWAPNQANYRRDFVALPADSALLRIFTGLGEFTTGELYGERMQVAYLSHDQEDEHSCFSDQTPNDFVLGQRSIDNVYFGRYTRLNGETLDGVGLNDLVAGRSSSADAAVQAALTKTKNAVQAIATRAQTEPFDQQIQGANAPGLAVVKAAIDAGKEASDPTSLGNTLSAAAAALGLKL